MPKYRAQGPDGKTYTVEAPDESTAMAAIKRASRPAGYSDAEGALATAGQGLTLNTSDEMIGGLTGLLSMAQGKGYLPGYRQGADRTRAAVSTFARERPWTSPLVTGAGGAVPVAMSMGTASIPGLTGQLARASTPLERVFVRSAIKRPVVAGGVTGAATGAAAHVGGGVTDEERFGAEGVINDTMLGGMLGAGAGAVFGRVLPGIIDMVGRRFLTPEQKAAELVRTKVLGPLKMTPNDVRLRAQRIRGSSSGVTGEPVFQAMGPVFGPGWRAARAVAQQQGPGQGIAAASMRASRFGVSNAGDDLASLAAGERVADLRNAARETGYTAGNQSRSGRMAASVARNVGKQMERGQVSFPDAARMVEQNRREFFPEAYERAFREEPANPEAALRMPEQLTDLGAIKWAADQLTASPQARQAFPKQLGNEEARILNKLRTARDQNVIDELQGSLADVRRSAEQLRTIAAGGELNEPLTARAAAMYKRGLDQAAASAGFYTPEGSAYVARGADIRSGISEAYPNLAQVDAQYAGNKTFKESMDVGRKALNMHPGELDQTIAEMSDDAFDGFLVGLHDDFQTRLGNNENGFASKIVNNRLFRERLDSVLGSEAAKDLLLRMARETNTEAASRFVMNNKNSPTAPMTEDLRAFTEGAEEGNIVNDLIALGDNPKGFLTRQVAKIYDRNRLPGIKNPQTNEALARYLFSPMTDANVNRLSDAINSLPKYGSSPKAKKAAAGLTVGSARALPLVTQDRRKQK